MTRHRSLDVVVMVLGLLLPVACEQTLRTGKVGNTTNAPSPDGTCPAGLTVCGKGAFAQCLDLQNDREHCGTCDNSCVAGIVCAAGACQQVACSGQVTVFTQTLAGSTVTNSPGDIVGALLADINGDGHPDLVTWRNDRSTEWAAGGHGTFQVALGEAGGGFGVAATYQASNAVEVIVAGDSNSDGFQDLYVSSMFGSPCVELWLGHADGVLTRAKDPGIPDGCLGVITIADLNGDGKMDLATSLVDTDGTTVFFADANGAFHLGTPACGGVFTMVRDWNGDGFPDLITLGETLGVCLNKGNGTFEPWKNCGVVASYGAVLGDFNRDGHVDVADMMGNNVTVLLGMGGCQFQPMIEYPLTDRVDALSSGDVNGDGLPELVAKTDDGKIHLLLGMPDGAFQIVSLSVGISPGYEEHGTLLVGDVTGDSKADIVFVPGVGNGGAVPVSGDGAPKILENTCP